MAWFEEFFDETYNRTYSFLDGERTGQEVDLMEKILGLEQSHQILDVPCGFGRHSAELTRRGYTVTGLELNQEQIDAAGRLMKEQGISFEVVQGDMRNIPFESKFDRVINFFTGFGYFDREGDRNTVDSFFRALKPDGMLLIDLANRDGILANFQKDMVLHLEDGAVMVEKREFDILTSRNHSTRIIIETDGSRKVRHIDLRLYSPHEIKQLLEDAGFTDVKIFDGNLKEISHTAMRMIATARRP